MRKHWIRFSVKSFVTLGVVVAAYFAGRVPWERAANTNSTKLIDVNQANNQVSLYASFWREIAIEYRDDIRDSGVEWRKQRIKRFGGGGSFVRAMNSDQIRPRAKRWKFAFSDEADAKLDELKSLKAYVICVWKSPPRIERWDMQANQLSVISEKEQIERWLIVVGQEEIFAILPDSLFSDAPQFVLLAIPNDVEILLASKELEALKAAKCSRDNVQTTTFGKKMSGETNAFEVMDQLFKQ
jgi:hypothetical protein